MAPCYNNMKNLHYRTQSLPEAVYTNHMLHLANSSHAQQEYHHHNQYHLHAPTIDKLHTTTHHSSAIKKRNSLRRSQTNVCDIAAATQSSAASSAAAAAALHQAAAAAAAAAATSHHRAPLTAGVYEAFLPPPNLNAIGLPATGTTTANLGYHRSRTQSFYVPNHHRSSSLVNQQSLQPLHHHHHPMTTGQTSFGSRSTTADHPMMPANYPGVSHLKSEPSIVKNLPLNSSWYHHYHHRSTPNISHHPSQQQHQQQHSALTAAAAAAAAVVSASSMSPLSSICSSASTTSSSSTVSLTGSSGLPAVNSSTNVSTSSLTTPLFVDCSVEYDLGDHPPIPANSEPLLSIHPEYVVKARSVNSSPYSLYQSSAHHIRGGKLKGIGNSPTSSTVVNTGRQLQQPTSGIDTSGSKSLPNIQTGYTNANSQQQMQNRRVHPNKYSVAARRNILHMPHHQRTTISPTMIGCCQPVAAVNMAGISKAISGGDSSCCKVDATRKLSVESRDSGIGLMNSAGATAAIKEQQQPMVTVYSTIAPAWPATTINNNCDNLTTTSVSAATTAVVPATAATVATSTATNVNGEILPQQSDYASKVIAHNNNNNSSNNKRFAFTGSLTTSTTTNMCLSFLY